MFFVLLNFHIKSLATFSPCENVFTSNFGSKSLRFVCENASRVNFIFFFRFIFVYSIFSLKNPIALLLTTHFQNRNPSTQTSTFDFSFILATKDADPRISSHQISIIYSKICDSKSTHTPVQPLSRTHTHTHGCAYTSMPRIPVFHQQISRNADSLHSVMRSRRCSFVPMFHPPPLLK